MSLKCKAADLHTLGFPDTTQQANWWEESHLPGALPSVKFPHITSTVLVLPEDSELNTISSFSIIYMIIL